MPVGLGGVFYGTFMLKNLYAHNADPCLAKVFYFGKKTHTFYTPPVLPCIKWEILFITVPQNA